MKLDGPSSRLLSEALCDAFDPAELERLLFYELDRKLATITLGGNLPQIVFELIQAANRQNWIDQLILAGRRVSPSDEKLFLVAQAAGLATKTPATSVLEALVHKSDRFIDVSVWRSRLAELEGRICRIEVPTQKGTVHGTGFLIADHAVLTNYHVIQELLDDDDGGSCDSADVRLRFDYKATSDGAMVNGGTTYRLAEDWLIDESPYDALDLEENPQFSPRPESHLDHAVLRLATAPGAAPIGEAATPGVPARGSIPLPDDDHPWVPHRPLFIMQHPDGDPLKLDVGTVLGVNENGTRVRYDANTLGGSSGSPCFDADWKLVALHHVGDPSWQPGKNLGRYNQGVPIAAIRRLLAARGKLNL